MSNYTAFTERKHELLDSAATLAQIVADRLDGRDIQLLEHFRRELKDDLSFKILCIGDFSSGKSTFINRFLLKQDILPAYPKPTTTRLTRVRYGDTLKATLFFQDATREVVETQVAMRLHAAVSTNGNDTARINHVVLEMPSDTLKEGIEIIDAPGLNDPDAGRMKVTFDFLHQADAILFFLNAQQPWTKYQKEFFEQGILARKDIGKLFVLANYWDCIPLGERAEVEGYINQELRALVRHNLAEGNSGQDLSVLPISSKTGENAAAVQERIWNYLSERKFYDVLSDRAHRLNTYIDSYQKGIDTQILLARQDKATRDKQRAEIEREIKHYGQQRDALIANLKRFLKPEFQEYEREIGELFDRFSDRVVSILDELAATKIDATFNTRLNIKLNRLQDDLVQEQKRKDREFLKRVADRIEEQKGAIDSPTIRSACLEDYFLKLENVDNSSNLDMAANATGAIGIAGALIGLGAIVSTLAAPTVTNGMIVGIWSMVAGHTTAATSMAAFGLPGMMVAVAAVGITFLLKEKKNDNQTRVLIEIREQLTDGIAKQKNLLIEKIAENRDQNIENICNDVDHEINTAYKQKLQELEQIAAMEDAEQTFELLRRDIDALRVKVNP
ncbi:MAG: dynamin family protein [Pseudomonadota bacterium]|nr:dynamin family protein [Pseudomonadota bacterium]MDP2353322.1 dynamin family protein [Pseudomonadota bacterium]